MPDTSRSDMSRLIRHIFVFGEKGMKTCCDDANLYIKCHVCAMFVNRWGSCQLVCLIYLI